MARPKLNINIDVTSGRVLSGYVEAPFFHAQETLKEWGFGAISLKKNAQLRMQEGKDAYISENGNWVREGVIYLPSKRERFLVRESPLLKGDFSVSGEQLEKALADSVKITGRGIPTREFGENEVTDFAFGEHAEEYGRFLEDAGATMMTLWLKPQDFDVPGVPAIAKQVWFGGLRPYRVGLIANDDTVTYLFNSRSRGLYHYPASVRLPTD